MQPHLRNESKSDMLERRPLRLKMLFKLMEIIMKQQQHDINLRRTRKKKSESQMGFDYSKKFTYLSLLEAFVVVQAVFSLSSS